MSPIKFLSQLSSRCRSTLLLLGLRPAVGGLLIACIVALATPSVVLADASDDAYQLAAGFYKKERWDLASDAFQKFIKQYPTSPRVATARFFLGLAQVNTGDYKGARDTLRIFLQEAPMSRNVGHAIYRIAESSYLLDDFARAEPELTTFITKYPEDPLVERALPYLADVQLRVNKVDVALKTFQDALKKFPAGPMAEDCEFGIAKCYEAQKKYQPTLEIYTRLAAKKDSERAPEAQLNLGNRLYDLDQFDKAAAAFAKLEQAFPQSPLIPIARLNHGFSLFEVSLYAQAAEQFAIAEKDPKQVVEAGYWRGRCLSSL
ncbi:MAG: Tetratricopeptide 2 repeat protein, partial [Planctomycetaceae bacterium]|nr:Tetratricopeptide 2 repeat protein [Planctomycetaceae bacterium]